MVQSLPAPLGLSSPNWIGADRPSKAVSSDELDHQHFEKSAGPYGYEVFGGLRRASGRIGWQRTKSSSANMYRSGPTGRSPWGMNQHPSLAAGSRLYEFEAAYGRPFAMIYPPSTGAYTVVLGTEPDGAALVDPEQIDSWVADWGY